MINGWCEKEVEGNFHMSDEVVASFLTNRGYLQSTPVKYAQWLGFLPGYVIEGKDEQTCARCKYPGTELADEPKFCGVLQADWGKSTFFKEDVSKNYRHRLGVDR